jgi:hypothetical protein
MADQSRHKSMDTLRGYVPDAEIFKDYAGTGFDRPIKRLITYPPLAHHGAQVGGTRERPGAD